MQLRDARTGNVVQTLLGEKDDQMMTAQFAPPGHALLVGRSAGGLQRVEIVEAEG